MFFTPSSAILLFSLPSSFYYVYFPSTTTSTLHRPCIDPTSTPHRNYIDPTSTLHSTFFSTLRRKYWNYIPPPPHFYNCFPTAATFPLFSFHHHRHISIVFPQPPHFYFFPSAPPPLPPHFYCFPSTTTATTATTFLLFSLHHQRHISIVFPSPPPPPLPPPHFYCFSLLLPLLLISSVFTPLLPPSPPPQFYCFPSKRPRRQKSGHHIWVWPLKPDFGLLGLFEEKKHGNEEEEEGKTIEMRSRREK